MERDTLDAEEILSCFSERSAATSRRINSVDRCPLQFTRMVLL